MHFMTIDVSLSIACISIKGMQIIKDAHNTNRCLIQSALYMTQYIIRSISLCIIYSHLPSVAPSIPVAAVWHMDRGFTSESMRNDERTLGVVFDHFLAFHLL
eukprot:699491_1